MGCSTVSQAEAAYRVVQEALTNVLRRAPGAAVRVTMTKNEQALVVEVQDAGPGPRPDSALWYGLVGIAEHAHRLGGEAVSGTGAVGRGFVVTARLP
jgi:signal transduction histidine kinase